MTICSLTFISQNETERKVEQRLRVLRNNPTAKRDFKSRVSSYLSDMQTEQEEKVAKLEFAAERREQKVSQVCYLPFSIYCFDNEIMKILHEAVL